ncbi:MFS transporter [Halobacterium wangiae]|uniref:MFS transporter n=1 Tax=Halobacterium wangiae TaxID=2902623 RepID=UPI001E5DB8C0|nr:MFS transporter [Halobacterium wangiae]
MNDDSSRRVLAAVFPAGLPNRALVVLGVGLFGMGLAVGSYGAAVTRLLERGVAPGVAGLGMTLFLLGQLVVVAPADRLTRTRRSALVATVGLLAGAAAVALSSVGTVGTTLVARGLLGLGQGAAFVGAMKHVGRRTPGDLVATAQGLLGALFTLGLAVALAVAPTTFDAVGVPASMLVVAVVVAVGAAGAPFLDRGQSEPLVPVRAYLAPLRSRVGLALGLGNMATFGFLIVATTWYVDALEGVAGVPATATLLAFAATTVVGRALGGLLAARLGEPAVVRWSLLGLAAALAGMAAGVHYGVPALLVVGVAGTGFGFSVPFGPLFALAFSNLADDAGVTLVVMLAVGNAGALAYPWLVGELVAATATYATGFAAMSATVVGIWVLWRSAIGGAPAVTLDD